MARQVERGVRVGRAAELLLEGGLERAQLGRGARLGGRGDEHGAPPGGAGEPFRQAGARQLVAEHEPRPRRLARERFGDALRRPQVAAGVDHGVGAPHVLDEPRAGCLPQRLDLLGGDLADLAFDRHAPAAGGAQQRVGLRDVVPDHAREGRRRPEGYQRSGSPAATGSVKPG